ncbi:MAG TPA: TRAP transporter large permease [Oligoflexus sp.]|uniref:TRAP transporter large permease n=1 Tax=Oligoflexus sp. TaxID=1971216 RepID=UPI002D40E0D7|nr:TRAP transporter large permease [Oligoflexus sp.]HYX36671.1 TRAP transporter large permease [Oligoflexus sp.]
MSILTIILILIGVFALIEVPLFTIFGALALVCLYFVDMDIDNMQTVLIELNRLASTPILVALPLFTLVSCILKETKAPQRIMAFMEALVGWVPGGMAIAGLLSCALLTTLTGASGVTIIALGGILYPMMLEKGYSERFTLGLLITGGCVGLLFPPSLPMILYGVVAQTDINTLFAAAFVPGVLMLVIIFIYCFIYDFRRRKALGLKLSDAPFSFTELWRATKDAIWELPIVFIIMIGIYGGFVTVNEVSAVILVWVIVVAVFIKKEFKLFSDLPRTMIEAAVLAGSIITILGFAVGFTGYMIDEDVPTTMIESLKTVTENKLVFLLVMNLFLLVVGCVMDIFSAIVVVVPILIPIAAQFGIDPIHLCIIFLVNLEIGFVHPPLGINLLIASTRFKKPIPELVIATLPYLVLLVISLLLITYIPWFSLVGVGGGSAPTP